MTEEIVQPKRTGLLIWLIVSQLITLIMFIPWLWSLTLSTFFQVFASHLPVYILTLICPALPIAMVIGAWVAYKRRKNMLAAVLSGLAILPLPILVQVLSLTIFKDFN